MYWYIYGLLLQCRKGAIINEMNIVKNYDMICYAYCLATCTVCHNVHVHVTCTVCHNIHVTCTVCHNIHVM